ncbi:MAG: hypothetical protein CVU00_05320 [Bacteroidetes bacterium HGW-Bacteroidetes-17]|jgi:hypothetical protein|nr:MAG: hypothetical protein CVU00_05320 [Bacteroidetes bacterium HGW-Bacteroidetes-17]
MIRKIILFIVFILSFYEGKSKSPFKMNGNVYCFLESVQIEGRTNLNKFILFYDNPSQIPNFLNKSTLINSPASGMEVVEFIIPIKDIQGKNENILRDFRTMMNSKEYPNVIVEIDKIDFLSIIDSRFQQKLYMKLTFAGISNSIITEYMIHENSDGKIKLQGLTKVKLSDFKLTPPKKILGLIKVQDVIFITFDILINESQ